MGMERAKVSNCFEKLSYGCGGGGGEGEKVE